MSTADQLGVIGKAQLASSQLAAKILSELPMSVADQLKSISAQEFVSSQLATQIIGELPSPPTGPFQVILTRPRLLINSGTFAAILAKLATTIGISVLKGVVSTAQGAMDTDGNVGICAAFLYALAKLNGGTLPTFSGVTYGLTPVQYAQIAITQLMTPGKIPTTASWNGNPHISSLNWTIGAMSYIYDWCFDQFTPSQLSQAKSLIQTEIAAAANRGYNHWTTGPMEGQLALAETASDPGCIDTFQNQWWKSPNSGQYNFALAQAFYADGGNPEGYGYSEDWYVTLSVTETFRSATTGDTTLDTLGMLDDLPYWYYQCSWPWTRGAANVMQQIACTSYEGWSTSTGKDEARTRTLWALTGSKKPDVASLAMWLLKNQSFFSPSSGAWALIFQVLIGDPRVTPALPSALTSNPPADRIRGNSGHCVFFRSNVPTDMLVGFASGTTTSRATSDNSVALYDKGMALLVNRKGCFDHNYAFHNFANSAVDYSNGFNGVDNRTLLTDIGWDPADLPRMPGMTVNADGSFTGEVTNAMWAWCCTSAVKAALGLVSTSIGNFRRHFVYDKPNKKITLYDTRYCDTTKISTAFCWNTPTPPTLSIDGQTVTIANGSARCVMTFDRPVNVWVSGGGEGDPASELWAKDRFGNTFTGSWAGGLRVAGFKAATETQKLLMGGRWRIEVIPVTSAGPDRFELGTVIQVN